MFSRTIALFCLLILCRVAVAQNFLLENFNVAPGATFPTGWQAVSTGAPLTEWNVQIPFTYKGFALNMRGTNYAFANGDPGGQDSETNSTLTSPAVNTSAATLLYLEFYQHYKDYSATPTDSGIVEIFNGTKWIRLQALDHDVPGGTNPGNNPEKTTFNITAHKNPNMRVRFRYVGIWPWFWAVDDVRIFSPVANDIGVSAIVSPSGSCGLTSTTTVKVQVTNYGSAAQNSVPLNYSVNGGTPVSQTFPANLSPGGTAEFTFTTTQDLTAAGDYFFTSWSSLGGDAVAANDSTKNVKVTKTGSNFGNLSFTNYDGVNLSTIYPGWTEQEGLLPLGLTSTFQPSNAAQTDTFGTKTAAVNLFTTSRNEWLVSPAIIPTAISGLVFKAAVTVWQKNGPISMGSDDKVKIMLSNNCGVSWTPIRTYDKNSGLNEHLTYQAVPLFNYAGQEVRVAFYASDGTVDDPEDYDFHLDSIRIANIPPIELAVNGITSPLSGCALATPQLKAFIVNQGTQPQTNFQVCAKINGGAPICQSYSGTLAPGTGAEFTFTPIAALNNPGDYNIVVYTNVPGDADRSNDTTLNYFFQNIPNVISFPYAQSFESNNGGWIPGGTFPSWALGTPAKPTIQGAAQGSKAYVTGGLGNGTYNPNEKSYVLGPCMNFSTLTNPVFEMKAWWASEFSEDGAVLQSTIDGGATWQTVGVLNDVSNWYNDNTVDGVTQFITAPAQKLAWSGGLNDNFGSGGWVVVKNNLKKLGGKTSVRLRIAFGSGANNSGDGFAFDDIKIYEKADRDMAIVSFVRPLTSGCGLSDTSRVKIQIKNVGKLPLTNPVIAYQREGGPVVSETYTGTLDTNAYYTHSFAGVENLSQIATYNFKGWVNVTNDAHRSDDSLKKVSFTKRGIFEDTVRFTNFAISNLPVLYSGWTVGDGNPLPAIGASQWRNSQPNQQTFFGRNAARINLYGGVRQGWILGPSYKIQPNAYLNFEVAITEAFGTVNVGGFQGTDDRLRVMVSTNCGDSWVEVYAVKATDQVDSTFRRFKANLNAYAGQEVRFAFWATTFPVADVKNYDLFLDNIFMESLEPFDAGATAIQSPLTACGLGESVQVKINIRNYGAQPISAFPVYYKVNQSAPVVETFSQTLQPGASGVYTFANTANLSLSQPYTITAGTTLTGDNNETNNTVAILLAKGIAPFPPQNLSGYTGSNLSAIWSGWTEAKGAVPVEGASFWTNGSFSGQNVLKIPLANHQMTDWILSPPIKLGSGNILKFSAGQFAVNGTGAAQFDVDDSVSVVISTDCGTSWKRLLKLGSTTIPALTNNMLSYSVSLAAYNNQEVRLGFRAKDGTRIDFPSDLYLSNIEVLSSMQLDASPLQISFTPSVTNSTFMVDSTYHVFVKVSSLGSQAVNHIPVHVEFNNQVFLKDTIDTPVNSGQSTVIDMGVFTPTVEGPAFVAKVYTAFAGDESISNDTLLFNYKVGSVLPVTDVGVLQLLSPGPQMVAAVQYPVIVRVKNFGNVPITNGIVFAFIGDNNLSGPIPTLSPNALTDVNLGQFTPLASGPVTGMAIVKIFGGDSDILNDTLKFGWTVLTGLEKPLDAFSFSMYPNPAHREVYITTSNGPETGYPMDMFNAEGRKVATLPMILLEPGRYKLELPELPAGLYLMRSTGKDHTYSGRLSVE